MDFKADLTTLFKVEGKETIISKGEYLLREGEIEHHIYYVMTGAIRAFLFSENEDITIRFGYEGSVINSLASFITGEPSAFSLQAIRKTSLISIRKQSFESFIFQNIDRMSGYTALLEQTIVQQIDRENDLLTSSPSERLKRVMQRSPNLFQHVPLKYIASYLRMTPETLSRIRKS
ncbi:MAG: Crp/Fnr family transcriptional regulator [Chitinophagaceae bacterium]|jgi:CRP-like cAMP-binding protein